MSTPYGIEYCETERTEEELAKIGYPPAHLAMRARHALEFIENGHPTTRAKDRLEPVDRDDPFLGPHHIFPWERRSDKGHHEPGLPPTAHGIGTPMTLPEKPEWLVSELTPKWWRRFVPKRFSGVTIVTHVQ